MSLTDAIGWGTAIGVAIVLAWFVFDRFLGDGVDVIEGSGACSCNGGTEPGDGAGSGAAT